MRLISFDARNWRLLSTVVVSLAVLGTASSAKATPVSAPADFYSSAIAEAPGSELPASYDYVSPIAGISTGKIADPVAQITSPVTSQITSPAIYEIGTGNSSALADRATAQLHAAAGALSGPQFPADAQAEFGDTLYFTNQNATATTITTIGFDVHIDGALSGDIPGVEGGGSGLATGEILSTIGNQVESGGEFAGFNPVTSDIVSTGSIFMIWNEGGPLAINEDLTGTFSFEGPNASAAIFMDLYAAGQYQYSDFSDTATFSFDTLPAGVSFTSASGDFLTGSPTAVPEPSTLALLGAAFFGLGFLRRHRRSTALLAFGIILSVSAPSWATPFTGPTSPYYLDDYNSLTTGQIYVVQGTSVVNTFGGAYGPGGCSAASFCESNLAVTSVVSTNWFGTAYGTPGTAGQYTLGGTPTGTSWTNTPPPAGEFNNEFYDGTSDGAHNYTVEFFGQGASGAITENVIATNLNWQNPVVLFSVQSAPGASGQWLGITYDPANNSLWLSGWGTGTLADYSLTGALLSSFTTSALYMSALGFDPADGTLWFSNDATNELLQYSTSGTLLQDGILSGLPGGYYLAGDFAEASSSSVPVPEPTSLILFGSGLLALSAVSRRKRKRA